MLRRHLNRDWLMAARQSLVAYKSKSTYESVADHQPVFGHESPAEQTSVVTHQSGVDHHRPTRRRILTGLASMLVSLVTAVTIPATAFAAVSSADTTVPAASGNTFILQPSAITPLSGQVQSVTIPSAASPLDISHPAQVQSVGANSAASQSGRGGSTGQGNTGHSSAIQGSTGQGNAVQGYAKGFRSFTSRSYSSRSYSSSMGRSSYGFGSRYGSSRYGFGGFGSHMFSFGAGYMLGRLFHPFGGYYGYGAGYGMGMGYGYHHFSILGILFDLIILYIIWRVIRAFFRRR